MLLVVGDVVDRRESRVHVVGDDQSNVCVGVWIFEAFGSLLYGYCLYLLCACVLWSSHVKGVVLGGWCVLRIRSHCLLCRFYRLEGLGCNGWMSSGVAGLSVWCVDL